MPLVAADWADCAVVELPGAPRHPACLVLLMKPFKANAVTSKTQMCVLCPCAAAGALAALQGKRDILHRRCEGLLKCKNEFAELARAL